MSNLRTRLRTIDLAVTSSAAGYRLEVDPEQADVVRFERLVSTGLAAMGDGRPDVASRLLSKALEEFSGEALADVLDAPFAPGPSARPALRPHPADAPRSRRPRQKCFTHGRLAGTAPPPMSVAEGLGHHQDLSAGGDRL